MRKVVLQMQVSLDGFIGTPSGDVDWVFRDFDDELTAWTVDSLWQAGVHIMGGITGRDMVEYWPSSTEPFAPPMNEIPKVIFSKTMDDVERNDTRIERGDLVEEISRLKGQPGKDILAHGGARFAQSLSRLGLIDEYRLVVHPVALGSGLHLFPELADPLYLELEGTTSFGTGVVVHVYRQVMRVSAAA